MSLERQVGSQSAKAFEAMLETYLVTSEKTLKDLKQESNVGTSAPFQWTAARVERNMGPTLGSVAIFHIRGSLWLHEKERARFQRCFRILINGILF